jgi:(p)ppGpp synthase/HD superfamily hydrolase
MPERSHQTNVLTERFDAAYLFAADVHRDQRRKGANTPYIAHLMQVAGLVLEAGADEDTAIAALLHDAIEDQGGASMRAEIAARFGECVARIVDGCSDSSGSPKPPWRQRKQAHIDRIAGEPPEVRLVVTADKLHNTRSITADYRREGEALWQIFHGRRDGTLWYTHAMTAALVQADPDAPLLAELQAAVAELDRLTGFADESETDRD